MDISSVYLYDKNITRGDLLQILLVHTIEIQNIRKPFGFCLALGLQNLQDTNEMPTVILYKKQLKVFSTNTL